MIMSEANRFPLTATKTSVSTENLLLQRRKRWLGSFFLASTLGILSIFFGLGIGLFSYMALDGGAKIIGTVMLISALPLLMFAAHSMDKAEEMEIRLKIEYCKKLGSNDQ